MDLSLQSFVSAGALTHAEGSRAFYEAKQAAGGQLGPTSYDELLAARAALPPEPTESRAIEYLAHADTGEVSVRITRPSSGKSRAAYLDIHGGGFFMDSAARGDVRNAGVADALSVTVVSVDYRLAPEHPWPAAPDDCETAALWLAGAYELAADAINKNKGGDLQAVAKAFGSSVAVTPLFAATQPPAALATEAQLIKKAFALKEGEIGGPVETTKGIYAIKIKERKPAAVPPLARIHAQVEASARAEKAKDLARKKAEEALAALGKGGAGLKVQETGSFTFSDKGEVPKIGLAPALQEAAFTLTAAAPVPKEPFNIGETWYAVRLKDRSQSNPADFEKSKNQIRQQLLPKKQQDALDAWVKELRAKAKIETNTALLTD